MNIYVGNLPYGVSDDSLSTLFGQHGTVSSVKVIIDKITGKSKGFAFVDMPEDDQALAAIENLNGQEFEGRTIVVNKAKPREERQPRERSGGFQRRSRF